MKTIDLSTENLTAEELLERAVGESVMIKAVDGTSYILSAAEDLTTEVELLRRNHEFLSLLDTLKEDSSRISLEDVERRLQ
ncbi:MAG: hypothetical protein O2955_20685 [Planctomycetota bacterium]|nr:hypothetical protein [Planctomycetota bacterium]MDA1214927.1 hypothetical protein [Planctomycetota bacterium]